MAEAFRRNNNIRGITINNNEIKLSQYADDTTLTLDCSEQSLDESLRLLDIFESMSSLRLNCSKTEAIWIGSGANCALRLCPEKKF